MAFELNDMLLVMITTLFIIGVLTFFAGVFVLLSRTFGRDIRTLATQTNRLAQKGMIDGIAGLVGNASALMEAINQLVRTNTGIGAFLIIIGLIMITGSVFILFKIV